MSTATEVEILKFRKRQRLLSIPVARSRIMSLIEKRAWQRKGVVPSLNTFKSMARMGERNMRHDFVSEQPARRVGKTWSDIEASDESDGVNLNIWINMIYYLDVINNISHSFSTSPRDTLSNFHGSSRVNVCLKIVSCRPRLMYVSGSCWWRSSPKIKSSNCFKIAVKNYNFSSTTSATNMAN